MGKHSPVWTILPLALACKTAEASRDPQPRSLDETVVALTAAEAIATPDAPKPVLAIDQVYPGLRRSYSRAEMKLHPCTTPGEGGAIIGHKCPSGVVAFGPSAVAPTHSDVCVRFDIESQSRFELASDIVSDNARQRHGKLVGQTLAPKEKRSIDYCVHVFEAVPRVDARIALHSDAPLDFRITNLEVSVR